VKTEVEMNVECTGELDITDSGFKLQEGEVYSCPDFETEYKLLKITD